MARITAFVAAATLCNAWTPARQIRPRSLRLHMADEDFDVDMMLLETEEKMQKSIMIEDMRKPVCLILQY